MAGPLIYVGTHAIKRGRQEDAKTSSRAPGGVPESKSRARLAFRNLHR